MSRAQLALYSKTSSEKLDYGIDWTDILTNSDTIVSSAWTLPTGITQASPAPSISGNITTIWLSGGTTGVEYTIVNRITTTLGRIIESSFTIFVLNTV